MEKFFQIKEYFKSKGLTYASAGKMLNASHVYVSNILNGKQELGKNGCRKWADTFGFSYYYLLTGKGDLFNDSENKIINETIDDVEQNIEPDSAEYWKLKYVSAEKEINRLNGIIEGMRMAMQCTNSASNAFDTPKVNVG